MINLCSDEKPYAVSEDDTRSETKRFLIVKKKNGCDILYVATGHLVEM